MKDSGGGGYDTQQAPLGALSKKRGMKQVWLPVPVWVIGEEFSEIAGKRPHLNSVFDRMEQPEVEGEFQRESVFDRIEDPSADPGRQGHREP
jgi:hypothetical protein